LSWFQEKNTNKLRNMTSLVIRPYLRQDEEDDHPRLQKISLKFGPKIEKVYIRPKQKTMPEFLKDVSDADANDLFFLIESVANIFVKYVTSTF
jgi:hypothetical protein